MVVRFALMVTLLLSAIAVPPASGEETPGGDGGVPVEQMRPKGDYLLFPSYVFNDPAIKARYFEYMKRFRVCLTNGYSVFEGEELAQINESGCELMVYRWFNGYYVEELQGVGYYSNYPGVTAGYQEIHRHRDWLLNPDVPIAGAGTSAAYFFDWANPGLRAFYIDYLIKRLDTIGYDGVFFDLIGDWALPEHVRALWSAKHPEMTYNQAGAQFVAELRAALGPERPIFGNGAYRLSNARDWYQHLSYDATESFATAIVYGKEGVAYLEGQGMARVTETFYRPWDGPAGYKQAMEWVGAGPMYHAPGTPIEFFLTDYVHPAHVATGDTAVVEGSPVPVYRRVPDRAAVHYGFALAKLYNLAAFASDWSSWLGDASAFATDDIYFADLGAPLEATYRESAEAVVRYFEHGFVVVTRTNSHNNQATPHPGSTGTSTPVHFTPDAGLVSSTATGLWDVYAKAPVAGWSQTASSVELAPVHYPISNSYYPSGRVYLYTEHCLDSPAPRAARPACRDFSKHEAT